MLQRLEALPLSYHIGILLLLAGLFVVTVEYVGTDFIGFGELNPVISAKADRTRLQAEHAQLAAEVAQLEAFKAQLSQKQAELAQLEAALDEAKVKMPQGDKRTDDFMRMLETSSTSAQVALRGIKSQAVVFRDFYAEVPFELTLDGPFYSIRDYFLALQRNRRIITVSGINFAAVDIDDDFVYVPGTSVGGTLRASTYYIPSDAEVEASAPPGQAGAAAARPGAQQPAARPGTPPRQ